MHRLPLALSFALLLTACGPAHQGQLMAPASPAQFLPIGAPPAGSAAAADPDRARHWALMDSPGSVKPGQRDALRVAAADLGGDRGAVLTAVAEWLESASRANPDPCDRAFPTRKRQSMDRLTVRFEELGRPDLAMFGRVRNLVKDSVLSAAAVSELVAWVDTPERRWLRSEALGRALKGLAARAEGTDRLLTVPLCQRYYADLLDAVERDRGDDVNQRNADRLMAAWTAAPACLDQAPVRRVTDRVVAAAGEDAPDPMTVLEALGGLAGNMALSAMNGGAGDLPILLGEVSAGLRRLREGLGNARDQRILHASLGVFAGAAELFRGRADLALTEVGTAADLLDHLVEAGVREDPSKVERLAPALRGASLASLALLQWLTDQGGLAAGTLKRLDVTLEGDLSALFSVLEVQDRSPEIARIVRGMALAIGKDWPAATAALDAASVQGPDEAGWWAVGLDAGRMVAWDLLAILAWTEAPETGAAALARGEYVSRRMVDDALEHFQVRDTGWELLTLLPMVQQAIPGFIAEDTDWTEIGKELARTIQPTLEAALARVPPRGDAVPGFTDLLVDLLRDATEVGLATLVDQGKDALPRLADLLTPRVDQYQGELRFIVGILAGSVRYFADREAGSKGLEQAWRDAPEAFTGVAWMPLLLDAVLRLRVGEDPGAALARLDQVLAAGERAASCNVDAPVHALLPARMWLREITGDHAGAVADHEAFRRITARGFPGYATLSCRLLSQRGGLTVNAQMGQSLGAFFLPVGTEGSFNLGAGWSTAQKDEDDLLCWAATATGPRDDAILHGHLAAAFYAMRAGDDAAAHRALVDAVAAGRRLVYADKVILGKVGMASVDAARKAVALDLVAWVTFTARLRGHISAADHLADQAGWLLAHNKKTWDEVLPEGHEAPVFLAGLPELPALGEHVRAWQLAADHGARAAVLVAVDAQRKRLKILTPWGIRLVRELQEISAANAAGKPMPALSGGPKDPVGAATVAAWTWIVALWAAPASFTLQDFITHADALAKVGLYREIVGVAATVTALLNQTALRGMVPAVFGAAVDRIPRERAPVPRASLLVELSHSLMASRDLVTALVAHQELVPAMTGRLPTMAELEVRLNLVNLLGAAEQIPALTQEIAALLPMLERRYSRTTEVYHSLLSVDVALRIFQDQDVPPDEALAVLVDFADQVKGAGPAKQFFRILVKTQDQNLRGDIAAAYLRYMFLNGPPLKEETLDPAGPKASEPTVGG